MKAMPKAAPRSIDSAFDRLCRDAKRICSNEMLMGCHLQHEVPAEGPRGEPVRVRVTVMAQVIEEPGS